MRELNIERFRASAASYLKRRGRYDEDVLSEMVLHALERPEKERIRLDLAYYNARERLAGRVSLQGRRLYRDRLTCSLDRGNPDSPDESWEHPAPEPPPPLQPLVKGELRAMVLLREVWGLSYPEIADLFGVTASRVSQRLGRGKAAVMCGGPPDRDLRFEGLEWDVDWLTL
jgi:DNA-directed RNA polymerase specialized sigma24 family protein